MRKDGQLIPIEFDAITGATKTSNGVKEMINNTLEAYAPFLNKMKATSR
ncbi:MAG: FMN-binding protein [Bacteroidales bacterium]|nr:FMN-binding protein [Bacteroidales bacterium]